MKTCGWKYYSKDKCWSIKYSKENEESGIHFCGSSKIPTKVIVPDKIISFNELLVISSVIECIHTEHTLKKIHAEIHMLKYGIMSTIVVPVFLCKDCGVYYIMQAEYRDLKNRGYICCRTMSYKMYKSFVIDGCDWAPQSLMAAYGYSVSRSAGLSESARHQILDFLAQNQIMSYIEQYDFIHWLVKNNLRKSEMSMAIAKWNSDREYLSGKFTVQE